MTGSGNEPVVTLGLTIIFFALIVLGIAHVSWLAAAAPRAEIPLAFRSPLDRLCLCLVIPTRTMSPSLMKLRLRHSDKSLSGGWPLAAIG